MVVGSHLVLGAAAWAAAAHWLGRTPGLTELGLAMAGALLPDLDHPKSWIGRRLFLVSRPLAALCGHRGVTHSLLAAAVCLGLLGAVIRVPAWLDPLAVGYLSHLAADLLTPAGVPLLWPWRKRFRTPLTVRTGGPQEYALTTALALAAFTAAGWLTLP